MPRLTPKNVDKVATGRHHAGVTGLCLKVTPKGVRRFVFRYKSPVTGRMNETGLGKMPAVDIQMAQKKALEFSKMVASGVDPVRNKREQEAAKTTFKEAVDGWIATHKSEWRGVGDGSQMRNAKVLLEKHGAPLLDVPVSQIDPDMVQAALEDLWARCPAQARRALEMWARVFDYARAHGMRQGDNPAGWRGMHEYRFPKRKATDEAHHPAVPYEQMPEFMRQLRARQGRSTNANALEFLILTGARSGEVRGARWSEFDFDKKLWMIPATRTKQKHEHVVPLTDRPLEILILQRQFCRGSEFVFTGYSSEPLADKGLMWVMRHMGRTESVHGFRSTFRDWAGNETEFPREHVEECLGHLMGNKVERAYRRRPGIEKRRAILEAWEQFCGSKGATHG
jgi:integrase